MPAFASWSVAGGLPVTRKRGGSIVSSSPRRHLVAFVLSGEKTARARVRRRGGRAPLRPGPPGSPRPGGFTWWLYSPAGPPGGAPKAWRPFLSTCTHRVCIKNPPHFRSARNDTLKVIPKSSGGRGRGTAGRAGGGVRPAPRGPRGDPRVASLWFPATQRAPRCCPQDSVAPRDSFPGSRHGPRRLRGAPLGGPGPPPRALSAPNGPAAGGRRPAPEAACVPARSPSTSLPARVAGLGVLAAGPQPEGRRRDIVLGVTLLRREPPALGAQ